MKIRVAGYSSNTFEFLDDDGNRIDIPVSAVDIRLRPDEIPTAIFYVNLKELDAELLPKGVNIQCESQK